MSSLPTLLTKLEALHRQHGQIEHEIDEVKRQIIATGKSEPKQRRRRTAPTEATDMVKATVKVLQDAGKPLLRREIASRLNVVPTAADYRLRRATAMKFVEKVGKRYRVSPDVPVL